MTEISTWMVWVLAVGFFIEAAVAPLWVTHERPKTTAYGAAFSMLCNVIIGTYLIMAVYA